MRSRTLGLILALLLAVSFGAVGHAQGQEATPAPDEHCGVALPSQIQPSPLPAGVTTIWACWSTIPADGDVPEIYSVGRMLRFDPNFSLVDSSGVPVQVLQHGFAAVTVLQGELNIKLIAPCATSGCDPDTGLGSAKVGKVVDSLNMGWDDLPLNPPTPTTITAGQTVLLENVTIELSAGSQGALVSSTGVLVREGGGGCTNVCVQFP